MQTFVNGCPEGEGIYKDTDLRPYDVNYAAEGISIQDGAQPLKMIEANPETHDVVRMPFVGCSIGSPVKVPVSQSYTHHSLFTFLCCDV